MSSYSQPQKNPSSVTYYHPGKTFKEEHDLDHRKHESSRITKSYPDRIPIIVEKNKNWASKKLPLLDKKKFLCPNDITVGQFQAIIRKRLDLEPDQGLFLLVGNKFLPPSSSILSVIYTEFQDEDGFLYVTYSSESVFG